MRFTWPILVLNDPLIPMAVLIGVAVVLYGLLLHAVLGNLI